MLWKCGTSVLVRQIPWTVRGCCVRIVWYVVMLKSWSLVVRCVGGCDDDDCFDRLVGC